MAKINPETKFIRSVTFINENGVEVSMIFQPYVVGLYLAIYEGGRIDSQSTVNYSDVSKIVKNFENDLKKSYKDVKVIYDTLGNYLKESDFNNL